MAASKLNLIVLTAMVVASMYFHESAAKTTHIVGDASGWTMPEYENFYAVWASHKTFNVGDVLLFNFTTGFHAVAEVSKAAYDTCDAGKPISLSTTGPARLTLRTAGSHYYICTFGAHCYFSQKLAIKVSAKATTTSSSVIPH